MGKVPEKDEKKSFIESILAKAYGKDEEPKPYKKQVTEEEIKKTENIVRVIKEKIK